MSKLSKIDNHVYNDIAIVAFVGTPAAWVAAGGGWIVGVALGVPMLIPLFIVVGLLHELIAKPPTLTRMAFVWGPAALLAYAWASDLGCGRLFSLLFAITVFTYGWGRSAAALRQMRLARIDPDSPHEIERAQPSATPALPANASDAPSVPEDLPDDLRTLATAAQQDYRHLCEALADDALADAAGVDADGMRDEAEQMLRDLLRRTRLVARLGKIAAERPDDELARNVHDEALAGLQRQASALRSATSAALQVAASAGHDPALLREYTDNLHLLHDVRCEARASLD